MYVYTKVLIDQYSDADEAFNQRSYIKCEVGEERECEEKEGEEGV